MAESRGSGLHAFHVLPAHQNRSLLRQRVLAIPNALGHFLNRVGIRGNWVFDLDVAVDGEVVFLDELQDFGDGRIALAPGGVWTVVLFPVFQVHAEDAGVVLFDEGHGGLACPGDVVSDVEVDCEVLAVGEHVAVVRGGCDLNVVVKRDEHLVFVGDWAKAFGDLGRHLARDAFHPEGLRGLEVMLDLRVGHVVVADVAELDDVDVHARVAVHLAEGEVSVHGSIDTGFGRVSFREFLRGFALELDGIKPAGHEIPEEIFGRARHGTKTVGDGANLDAAKVGIGLRDFRGEGARREERRRGEGRGAADEGAT